MTDERDFDRMLEDSLTGLPLPEQEARQVNPWRQAMGRIVWGIGLTSFTLNFLYLQYLLPAVGVVLLWLGLRPLRRENRWLGLCWALSLYRLAAFFLNAVWDGTILNAILPLHWLRYVSAGLLLLQYFALWRGLRAVRAKAGAEPSARAAGALVIWACLVAALGLVEAGGWLIGLPVLIAYIAILVQLSRLPALLEDTGYAVEAAPSPVSDRAALRVWFTALMVCVLAGALLLGRYPMSWTPAETGEQAELAETSAHLAQLGFPAQVLSDLSADDLAACAGALRVEADEDQHPFNAGREVRSTQGGVTHIRTEYDVYELKLTSVAVELPGGRWKVIHHFLWQADPGIRGTECIQLWTTDRSLDGWRGLESLTGRLLYDRDGVTYTGDFYSLGRTAYGYDSLFFGYTSGSDPMAAFSLPRTGENCRGYVAYETEAVEAGWLLDSWINYTHQVSRLNYPLVTALDYRTSGVLWGGAFDNAQCAIQFFPDQPPAE